MFCSSCGTPLVANSNFCHNCGIPVRPLAEAPQGYGGRPTSGIRAPTPIPAPAPTQKACFQCSGSGKVHHSAMPHSAGCIFCTQCPGCNGSGAIPGAANVCPKCQGQGRYHDSPMPHNNAGCIFCTDCGTCQKKGWIA